MEANSKLLVVVGILEGEEMSPVDSLGTPCDTLNNIFNS